MIGIICLIIGILGLVKGRINVTRMRELRGAPMYIVAGLFCLPLPLSFLVGVWLGVSHAAQAIAIDTNALLIAASAATWAPIILALILGFALSKPKEVSPPARPQGFEVKM